MNSTEKKENEYLQLAKNARHIDLLPLSLNHLKTEEFSVSCLAKFTSYFIGKYPIILWWKEITIN